jgi:hypothetical protein
VATTLLSVGALIAGSKAGHCDIELRHQALIGRSPLADFIVPPCGLLSKKQADFSPPKQLPLKR